MGHETALVVEGGAMRGMFSAGVLDVFLERRFDPFDLLIGTSAGACNLASHLAGQHGRNLRCYRDLMTRREFIDLRRAFGKRHVLDLDWLWDELALREPLGVDAILRSNKALLAVATCVDTGDAQYLAPRRETIFDVLKASCALPWFYRAPIRIDGRAFVDGGLSDPFAAQHAYRLGARRIVVIRSRPSTFIKKPSWSERWLAGRAATPGLARAHHETAARYREAVRFALSPPSDCMLIQVAPERPLPVSRITQDVSALDETYALGRTQGMRAIEAWERSPGLGRHEDRRVFPTGLG